MAGTGTPVAPSTSGNYKGVAFSRTVTAADASFATIDVSLPRSSKPIYIKSTISAVSAAIQVQGNGTELYSDAVAVNLPSTLQLTAFPESTYVNIQVEQFGASTFAGSLFFQ